MKKAGIITSILIVLSMVPCFAEVNVEPVKTVIVLPERYIVPSETMKKIRLGDVARSIESTSPEIAKKMAALPVMNAPEPGDQLRLSQVQVMQALRIAGFDFFNTRAEGAKLIEVLGAGQSITIASMVKAIQTKILKETNWPEDELVMRVVSTPTKDGWLPPNKLDMEITRINPNIMGATRYEVGFYQSNILVKSLSFIVSVSHKRSVFVPVRNINRGEVITSESLRELEQIISNDQLDQQIADSAETLIGSKCKTPLRKGDPVKWYALEINTLTKRGDLVQMIVRNGGVTLQTAGFAQKDGGKGDVIPVKTKSTGKVVNAVVLDQGLVELAS